ncbi:GPP34 family phosphoprotein [Streptomyces sp. NPDC001093]|uniref:GOLPH3/VPS74 family protein n=1 Tax=Streptomyces sp. NPDC001093 TaxID=3154376 RepID=UPI0033330887
MAGPLTLPEEFALLSLAETGKVIDSGQAEVGCAVAELGELALRGKLAVRTRKSTVFGLDAYRPYRAEIELVNADSTGLAWADELLAELAHAGEVVVPYKWVRRRRIAFLQHRGALVGRGLIRRVPGRGLLRRERYYPDPNVRHGLIEAVRLAKAGEHRLDEHMMFLSDMVTASQLNRDLGGSWPKRHILDRARGTGAVESVPESLRDTSAVLAALVPKRSRNQGG